MIADKRYYLNADRSRVVEEDDPDATYLLAAEGADISNEDVARYGLDGKKPKAPEAQVVHSIAADRAPADAPADVGVVEMDHDEYMKRHAAQQRLMSDPERQAELASLPDDAARREFADRVAKDAEAEVARADRRKAPRAKAADADDEDVEAKAVERAPENKARAKAEDK